MTDRGRAALRRSTHRFTVGPSSLAWNGARLTIEVDEWGAPPLVTPVRGRIVLTPSAVTQAALNLTPDGAHRWRPFAPVARIAVDLTQGHRWQGHGYFDANFGTRALEADFDTWTWGRFPLASGTACFYDATRRDGTRLSAALHAAPDGSTRPIPDAPPDTPFRRSLWAVARSTRADPGTRPRQVMAMLDAPFYSRSLVETVIGGERTTGVHEALDLRRFRGPWLMPMLALRVPRRAGWTFA